MWEGKEGDSEWERERERVRGRYGSVSGFELVFPYERVQSESSSLLGETHTQSHWPPVRETMLCMKGKALGERERKVGWREGEKWRVQGSTWENGVTVGVFLECFASDETENTEQRKMFV